MVCTFTRDDGWELEFVNVEEEENVFIPNNF